MAHRRNMKRKILTRVATARSGLTLVEMLVVVALTVLLMSIIAEVFVLASETLTQLRSVSEINQKIRSVESIIRLDLENRTIREVQPPVERKPGPDGVLGTADDYFLPIGFDPANNAGYLTIEENAPADEQGEDTDDVLAFTVRLGGSSGRALTAFGNAYVGKTMPTSPGPDGMLGTLDDVVSPPDAGFPPDGDGIAGSQEAEIIYFLRNGTLYRRVLLVGVPQASLLPTPQSWYTRYDISARPPIVAGSIPIVNSLGDLTYRSARYCHQVPANYATGDAAWTPPVEPGLPTDFPGNANFPFLPISFADSNGTQIHDAGTSTDELDHNYDPTRNRKSYPFVGLSPLSAPEGWFGRPTLRETSAFVPGPPGVGTWDYPDNVGTLVFSTDPRTYDRRDPLTDLPMTTAPQRPAEDAILPNVFSFDVKVWDPDAIPNGALYATGAYVDLGKMWPGTPPIGSVNTPGPLPTDGTSFGFPGSVPSTPDGPIPGTWPPVRRPGVVGPAPAPNHRGFAEPFGYDSPTLFAIPAGVDPGLPLGMLRAPMSLCRTYDTWCTAYTKPVQLGVVPVAPPYIVPIRGIQIKIRFADPETRLTREITIVQELN